MWHLPPLPLSSLLLICTVRPLGHMTHPDQSQTSRPLATDRGVVVYTRLPTLEKSGRVSPTLKPIFRVSNVFSRCVYSHLTFVQNDKWKLNLGPLMYLGPPCHWTIASVST